MKAIKVLSVAGVLLASSVAWADQPVLALSGSAISADSANSLRGSSRNASRGAASGATFTIDFMAGETAVTALNFDIRVSSKSESAVNLSQCTSGLQGSGFVGQCAFNNGVVTVVAFSPSGTALSTTTIGSISVKGSANIIADSVVMAAAGGVAVEAEVL